MKKVIIFTLSLLTCITSFSQKKTFTIKAEVPDDLQGTVYMRVYNTDGVLTIDSTIIEDGFFSFHKSIDEPVPIMLIYENDTRRGLNMFIENGGRVRIKFNDNIFSSGEVTGSQINILFNKAKEEIANPDSGRVKEYALRHPESIFAPYFVAKQFAPFVDYDELKPIMDAFVINEQRGYYFKYLENKMSTLASVQVGEQTPDFSAIDTGGQQQNLYEFIKQNKYTLIDFWASWCPPCRKENPNIVAAYDKYSTKGFGIFAFSLDNDINKWMYAIAADGLSWTHVSDFKAWNSDIVKTYSVNSIPANLLVDKDGNIVARNLKGEKLSEKLSELLD